MMFELKFDIKKENGSVVNKKYDTASDFLLEVESGNSDSSDEDNVENVSYGGKCFTACEGFTVLEFYGWLCSDACDWFS